MKKSIEKLAVITLLITMLSSCSTKETVGPTIVKVKCYNNISLGAQSNPDSSYYSSFKNLKYGSKTVDANISLVDISYAELGSSGNLVPNLLNTPERINNNLTTPTTANNGIQSYFKESTQYTIAQFDTLTNTKALNNVTIGSAKTTISIGKLYEFVSGTKKGLIKIISIDQPTPTTPNGKVVFTLKIQ